MSLWVFGTWFTKKAAQAYKGLTTWPQIPVHGVLTWFKSIFLKSRKWLRQKSISNSFHHVFSLQRTACICMQQQHNKKKCAKIKILNVGFDLLFCSPSLLTCYCHSFNDHTNLLHCESDGEVCVQVHFASWWEDTPKGKIHFLEFNRIENKYLVNYPFSYAICTLSTETIVAHFLL